MKPPKIRGKRFLLQINYSTTWYIEKLFTFLIFCFDFSDIVEYQMIILF